MSKNRMDRFFKWLSEPMKSEDVNTWYMVNNIIPELSDLFEDFCFSFYYLVKETYLGYNFENNRLTQITLSEEDKFNHFKWCWDKTIKNFSKENITFEFSEKDYSYFRDFFFEVFYQTDNNEMKEALGDFLKQLFNRKRPISQSDIEMFTDVYKTLERSLKI